MEKNKTPYVEEYRVFKEFSSILSWVTIFYIYIPQWT